MHDKINAVMSEFDIPLFDGVSHDDGNNYSYWQYTNITGSNYSDDEAHSQISSIYVHWFVPETYAYEETMKSICTTFEDNDFEFPNVSVLFEEDTKLRHIIFSTETVTAVERE